MRKIIAIILCLVCLFQISGCRSIFEDKEQEIYFKTIDELFAAIEDKNIEAIYDLFSPYAQNECLNLKDNIEELVSIFSGTIENIGEIIIASGASYDNENSRKNAYSSFPVFDGEKYYWFYIDLIYEDTFDESQLGITQIDFLSADAYYDFRSSETKQDTVIGLNIFNKKVDNYNIISINNYPYNYHPTETLSIEDVTSFFKSSTSLADFKKRFGAASAIDEFGFMYSLPDQNDEKRYLYISCDGDKITCSNVLSNYSYIDTLWEE